MHPLFFYKHQHDNRVRSKPFVARQRWWFLLHTHPVSWNCAYHLRMELSDGGSFPNLVRNWRWTIVTDRHSWNVSTQNAFFLPFVAILVNCAPSGEIHNYCKPHIIKENFVNFLIHWCNYILLSQVYCVWQVVKTPTIISNNPVQTSHGLSTKTLQFYACQFYVVSNNHCNEGDAYLDQACLTCSKKIPCGWHPSVETCRRSVFAINYILLSASVGWGIAYKNIHSMNKIKFIMNTFSIHSIIPKNCLLNISNFHLPDIRIHIPFIAIKFTITANKYHETMSLQFSWWM